MNFTGLSPHTFTTSSPSHSHNSTVPPTHSSIMSINLYPTQLPPPLTPTHLHTPSHHHSSRCLDTNEQRRVPARELLHHPFISPSLLTSQPHPSTTSTITRHTTLAPLSTTVPRRGSMQFQRSDSIVGSPCRPYLLGRSRLETEFEELEVLGSGGFGDVMKV